MDITASFPTTCSCESPISIKWNINEEKLAPLKDSNNGRLETEWINVAANISGVQYSLRIYPNGNNEQNRGKVWIYLHLRFVNGATIKSDVKYAVESTGFIHKRTYEYMRSSANGFQLCKTSEFFDSQKKFIDDGKFTLKCEGILSTERQKFAYKNDLKFDIGPICHSLWKNNSTKDFTINVGGKIIKVHKFILSDHSPVFMQMFESGINESKDITDFSFKTVESAIEFCYLGETSKVLNLKDKMELLHFCDEYLIIDLKVRLEASLIKDLSISNVCHLANCSIVSNATILEEKCLELLTKYVTSRTPVTDIALLCNDFALKIVITTCCTIIET